MLRVLQILGRREPGADVYILQSQAETGDSEGDRRISANISIKTTGHPAHDQWQRCFWLVLAYYPLAAHGDYQFELTSRAT